MELDIKKAFLSPFSDKRWYLKLIFPCAAMILILVFFDPRLMRHFPEIVAWVLAIALLPATFFLHRIFCTIYT